MCGGGGGARKLRILVKLGTLVKLQILPACLVLELKVHLKGRLCLCHKQTDL